MFVIKINAKLNESVVEDEEIVINKVFLNPYHTGVWRRVIEPGGGHYGPP